MISVLKAIEKVDPAKVSPTAHFTNDLGLDSLDAVEVRLRSRASTLALTPQRVTTPHPKPLTAGLHVVGGGVQHHDPRRREREDL